MLRKFLASTGLALFALSGCEDYALIADPAGDMRVVYVDGQPDHCIVGGLVGTEPAQPRDAGPALAAER